MRLHRRKIGYANGTPLMQAEMHDKVISRNEHIVIMHLNLKSLQDKYSYYIGMTVDEATRLRDQLTKVLDTTQD